VEKNPAALGDLVSVKDGLKQIINALTYFSACDDIAVGMWRPRRCAVRYPSVRKDECVPTRLPALFSVLFVACAMILHVLALNRANRAMILEKGFATPILAFHA
jgi:hypothetical protein